MIVWALMQQNINKLLQSYLKKGAPYKAFKASSQSRQWVEGVEGYPLALTLNLYNQLIEGRLWVIAPTEEASRELAKDLDSALIPYTYLPSSGKLLYSPWQGSEREYAQLKALAALSESTRRIVVTHLRAFVSPLISKESLGTSQMRIKVGDPFNPNKVAEELTHAGYFRSPSTSMRGEFSIHGEVIDFFLHDEPYPVRLYGDWDKIERITYFDPFRQETVKNLTHFSYTILGSKETLVTASIEPYLNSGDYIFFQGKERLEVSYNSLMVEAKSLYRGAFLEDRSATKPDKLLFDYPSFYERWEAQRFSSMRGQQSMPSVTLFDGPRSYFGNFTMFKESLVSI